MAYVLSVDCGTQSIRGIVFDATGTLLAKGKEEFQPYFSVEPGWAEQDPEVYWSHLVKVMDDLYEKHPEVLAQVESVVVTTQRDTCVLMDENGQVLRPAILWADNRTVEIPKKMKPYHTVIMAAIGMLKTAKIISEHCHAHWIQENEPNIWKQTYRYVQLSGYFHHRLTGKFVDSVANQIGHLPFNYKKGIWERPLGLKRSIFHIERGKLTDLVPSGTVIGTLMEGVAKELHLPASVWLVAGGSDKGCETLGVGCVNNQSVSISLGSQATIQTTTQKYYEVQTFIPPFPAVLPNYYNPEIQIYRGYWMVSWFKNEFALKEKVEAEKLGILPERILDDELKKISPGSEGLILQPYWGAGLKTPEAKGSILGFSDYHTRIHMYRAMIEGIGYALLDGMHKIEQKSHQKIQQIMISGGGSQSDAICQMTANIFRLPVSRVQTYETSSLGAAIIGYVANGTFASYESAVEAMVHPSVTFKPEAHEVKIYKELYEKIYLKTYKRIRPLYKTMHKIQKKC